ncbi:hypothetical protein PSH87_07235 [Pseudomonas sp. FP453]|jgi:hypothetical protein|uniref:hypothetical protein n=1 Tax=Pseudomonas sp. FP453 TaxID=2954094 RepID=UPI0027329AD6|nr:hypothetical protein [Pseudomonas sp. FP453]WLH91780.1 hypothetical protein PSH87_07235 [Pseudomonas sp. FP453]
MPESKQHTPKPLLRQVVGWVLVLPLLLSFVKLPFLLGPVMAAGSVAGSVYGVLLARRHASRRVVMFALIITLFNILSFVVLRTGSLLVAGYYTFRLFAYPHLYSWVYWNF